MQYDEFIKRVQERANLESLEEAVRATEATLETLGERLYLHRTERRHLASQLPKELGEYLLKRQGDGHYLLEEFYNRVSARMDVGYPHAVNRAQAVIAVLRAAVASGEWEHIQSKLPDEYDELLGEEPEIPEASSYETI